ncbi:hypothetical protein WR25_22971 [Diploscapter pachys]|uniref:Uncharacterized protein n=1 Tax=Diploscapter pachys TaxID=2018661 RepID=A0A2A2JM04_9BILA|nr:hypothetical protein WR25_22971 [Diploscapter pachys]
MRACSYQASNVPTPRSNTPKRVPSAAANVSSTNPTTKNVVVQEEFPEFPRPNGGENDTFSVIDDSASIATSLEDEAFEFDLNPDDDPFGGAEMAEEATFIDEQIINDRIYKSLMAKNCNVLSAKLSSIHATVNVHKRNVRVLGAVNHANLSYKLNILRSEVYDAIRKKQRSLSPMEGGSEQAKFCVNVPANSTTSVVNVNVTQLKADLDDEIIAHLTPFLYDEQVTENKVRLIVNVKDSDISIKDCKKKQPMKLKIKECVIEQDEDNPEDNLKTLQI